MLTFKNFNIADWFSFYRIAAAPFLLIILWLGYREIFTWLLLVSYLTDAVDGFLARKLKITSARGSQLDSFGDQITFFVGLIGVLIYEYDFVKAHAFFIMPVLMIYIFQMVMAFLKYRKATSFHTYLAKLSAIVQSIFILWLLFFDPIYWLFYVMIVLGMLETIEEIALIYMYDNWVAGVKGIYWALRDKRRLSKNQQ
jgi:CDP-diacylglycerol--glycerol-3-phosphate 3-phosphatidyltransferase